MIEQRGDTIFNYWGKAAPACLLEQKWHPLAYHSLDVVAVAASWWDASPTIQRTFLAAFGCTQVQQNKLRAWVLFFTALHDLGKFDVRFQLKAPDALAAAWRPLGKEDQGISPRDITGFDHGRAGMAWANQEYRLWLDHSDDSREIWKQWKPWLAAVTGHHGDFYEPTEICAPEADDAIIAHDRAARHAFISALADIFLTPEGLGIQDLPPLTSPSAQSLLAGFCSVCDWIGSNTEFAYQTPDTALADYFAASVAKVQAGDALHRFGLLAKAVSYKGLSNHVLEEMERRGIPREMLERVLDSPQQVVVEREGKKAYQSQTDFGGGRMYLLRAIVNDALDPAVVVTVYRTRNIQKYWRLQ